MSYQPGSGGRAPNQPFQEGGEWRSYDDAGRLLRWDDRTQTWVLMAAPVGAGVYPPPYQAAAQPYAGGYQAAVRPAFTSLKTPAMWIYIALGLTVAATLFYMYGVTQQISVIRDLKDPGSDTSLAGLVDDAETADDLVAVGTGVQAICMILTAGVFIWWTRRATCNVPALGAQDRKFTPGWSVAWWFIPFANLVQPLRVINQAWRASDLSAVQSGNGLAWKAATVGPILLTWWLVWIGGNLVSGGGSSAYDEAETLDSLEQAAIVVLAGEFIIIAAAVLAILVVRQLTQRHELANEVMPRY